MSLQESAFYTVRIHLHTNNGELPSNGEVEQLILTQMSGNLDEDTGLFCTSVDLLLCHQADELLYNDRLDPISPNFDPRSWEIDE